ncbi:squamous cell carcinoma antigen recognized by T-cells 3, partial [Phenoliferia sp. Uapishka_3]
MEASLKAADEAEWAWLGYLKWELEPKVPNEQMVKGLFERATRKWGEVEGVWELWLEYANTLPKAKLGALLTIAERAIKHLPANANLWALYFLAIVRLLSFLSHPPTYPPSHPQEKNQQSSETLEALFQRAIGTGLLTKDVEGLVTIYEARAGFHRREIDGLIKEEELEAEMIDPVVEILEEGLEAVKRAHKKGDPSSRLEKYLLRMYERFGRVEEASELWSKLVKLRPYSYATWYGYADFETRLGSLDTAQEIYKEGCSQKGLDYPEYLLEAWAVFVRQNGTFSEMEYTLGRIKRQKKGLEGKRAREAAAAAAAEPVATTTVAQPQENVGRGGDSEMMDGGKKRERSPVLESSSKKAKTEAKSVAAVSNAVDEPKRDRENSTVIVITSSETQATEDDIKALFKDCGEIRELKLKTIGEHGIAMIEFMNKDSVLAAQTKDKKKINGTEVEVHIAWKSCLWVTNYPESYDKAAVEKMFSKYGTIFDTRWPSKRFKSTRRFCYVQFTSTEAAQASLELHQKEMEGGLKLQVAISDPAAKKGRTDVDANQKELYVAGLSKFVKELDLKRLFEPFGALKGIRVGTDDQGECKGFAFVEYEDEAAAKASLSLNNHELKKRHMSVTIAQSRITGVQKNHAPEGKTEQQGRSVRVRGIKPGTEEAIVQQAFEKFAAVRVVQMTPGSTEAVVELESVADAGKILMSKDSILVDDVPVEVTALGRQVRTAEGKKPSGAGADGERLMPRQASRGRGRVGLAGARGSRGRPGLGARPLAVPTASVPVASTSSSTPAAAAGAARRSQDDFRALLAKKT